jgi:amidophosphoribosyltransferase
VGYAEASGIPYGLGLVKNAYVGRTFIQPSQTIRQLGIRLKLNPLPDVIRGKRLVVVDDSIVRGNTQRALVRMLREAGATEVHVRISSPPVTWPCFYGIDFASKAELIANGLSVDEIAQAVGADSLAYVSLDGLIASSRQERDKLCTACFTGIYPIALPDVDPVGKHILEGIERGVTAELAAVVTPNGCDGSDDLQPYLDDEEPLAVTAHTSAHTTAPSTAHSTPHPTVQPSVPPSIPVSASALVQPLLGGVGAEDALRRP